MKKVLIGIACVAVWFSIFLLPSLLAPKKERYHCPICDAQIKYEAEPEDIRSWIEKQGYALIREGELTEYVWEYLQDDDGLFEDLMSDYAEDYLIDNGWTLIPPEG